MFRGASAVNLDAKGRLAIPTRYRAELLEQNQGQMVCTVDIRQPCLLLYPLKEWEVIEQKLLELSNFDPVQRSLQRVMLGYATECWKNPLCWLGNLISLKFGVMLNGKPKWNKIWHWAQQIHLRYRKN